MLKQYSIDLASQQLNAVQLSAPRHDGNSSELSTRYKPKPGEIPNGKAAWDGTKPNTKVQ